MMEEIDQVIANEDFAIHTEGLAKDFGKQTEVIKMSISVPRGCVFGFLGRNGAGKTTTIRMLLNILPPDAGTATVLGLDSVKDALEIKHRIGYVAQDQKMYDWMTVNQIIWFCKGFYPSWDDEFVSDAMSRLELHPYSRDRVRNLSKGTQEKLALLLATAHKPELLILDEPTAGLDVMVRRQFLEGLVDVMQEQNRTVFFSSHLVHEVERVADWVGIIRDGRLVVCDPVEKLKSEFKRVVFTYREKADWVNPHKGLTVLKRETSGRQKILTLKGFNDETTEWAKNQGTDGVDIHDLSLEEIFVAVNEANYSDVAGYTYA